MFNYTTVTPASFGPVLDDHVTVVTHDGVFHADEVAAVAALRLVYPRAAVVRTRDQRTVEEANIVVDVGGVYCPEEGRFDHHQPGGVVDGSGRLMAAAGLVWSAYGVTASYEAGKLVCPGVNFDASRVASRVKERLIDAIDVVDVGGWQAFCKDAEGVPSVFSLSNLVAGMNPHPLSTRGLGHEERFNTAVGMVQDLLVREIEAAILDQVAEAEVLAAAAAAEGGVMELRRFVPWANILREQDHAHVRRVVFQDLSGSWRVTKPRWAEDLPEAWAGLRGEDMKTVTGISDSIFCHPARFIAGFETREGALAAAKIS